MTAFLCSLSYMSGLQFLQQWWSCTDYTEARLDITTLVPVVHQLFAAGLAPSTQRVYQSGESTTRDSASQLQIDPLPHIREDTDAVCGLSAPGKASTQHTIKSYLATTRYAQIAQGLGDHSLPQLERRPHPHPQGAVCRSHQRFW